MQGEPSPKRCIAFFDGQNLFHSAKQAFGYTYPNYDALPLAREVIRVQGWRLDSVRFYTGVPEAADNPFWSGFWAGKLGVMGRQSIVTFSRPLRYRWHDVKLPDGTLFRYRAGEEKGIDVRIAVDVIRLAHRNAYDVALIFSQDQDLSEVAGEIRVIAKEQGRWIKIASAFPDSAAALNRRGIEKTDWVRITKDLYDRCLDRRDYRLSKAKGETPGGPE